MIHPNTKIHPTALVEEGAVIGEGVIIGPFCIVEGTVEIKARTVLKSHVVVRGDTVIGEDNEIYQFASIGEVNQDLKYNGEATKTIIGNNVEIGACTCIDRGALDATVIEDNVIIDNLCQIAHNVHIGTGTAVAGGVIMAGSLTVGRYCLIGGASVINGHMEICDKVTITGMGMVMRPITEPGVYSSGIPLQTNKEWRKTAALTLGIDEINKRVKALEKKIN